MSRIRRILVLAWAGLLLAPGLSHGGLEPGKGAQVEPAGTSLRKLQRGFLNVALSPIDISHELHKEKKRQTLPPSWVIGLCRGAIFAGGRAIAGVLEMLTFWDTRGARGEPLVSPEFAWDHLENQNP